MSYKEKALLPLLLHVVIKEREVTNGWDSFMFQQAHNWDDLPLPEEVKKKLSTKAETAGSGRAWVSLDLGKEN